MVRNDIIPAISEYSNEMCVAAANKMAVSKKINCSVEIELAERTSDLLADIYKYSNELEKEVKKISSTKDIHEVSFAFRDIVIPLMDSLRNVVDSAEVIVGREYWPYPTYTDMLFYL